MDKPMLRKSHSKSRFGCLRCKTQKIKCDEAKPSCRNCTKRDRDCVYGKQSTKQSLTSTPDDSISVHKESESSSALKPSWYYEDSELLLHYVRNTAVELGGGPFWLEKALNVGKGNHTLLHLVLALSAYHLASIYSDQVAYFYEKASEHYTIALRPLLKELHDINKENASRLFVATALVCFINFGKGPEPGQYIAFSDEGSAEWLALLDGAKIILLQFLDSVNPSNVIEEIQINAPAHITPYRTALNNLRSYILSRASTEQVTRTCIEELDNLTDCYIAKFDGATCYSKPGSRAVMSWLFHLSDSFRQVLQDKESLALLVYAYYPVLLLELSKKWPFTGWPFHILHGIKRHLPNELHCWLSWPEQMLQLYSKAESTH